MNKLKVIIAGVLAVTVLAFATVPVANAQYNLRNGADAAKGDGAANGVDRPNDLVKIMYAVIGLVVAIFAYAIVNFVLVTSTGVGS